ncbi:hypothetical protein HY491_02525 [Candidatus Woesearchaeota archaeon]|nr:hypothetical protein [Candidatus Woesearchaeota archaeon]
MAVRIAADIDGILINLTLAFRDFLRFQRGRQIHFNDFTSLRWDELLGITRTELGKMLFQEFYPSPYFQEAPILPGALAGISFLAGKYGPLPIITTRHDMIAHDTRNITESLFGKWISGIYFAQNPYITETNGARKTKMELCRDLSITHLLEDDPEPFEGSIPPGLQLLSIQQPWNATFLENNFEDWPTLVAHFDPAKTYMPRQHRYAHTP